MKAKPVVLLVAAALLIALGLHQACPDCAATQAFDRAVMRVRQAAAAGSTEAHKCVSASRIEYSSGKCPAGTVEASITGGTMTVVPAAAVPKPASSAASVPTVRALLAPAGEPDLLDERIKRATGG